MSENTFAFICLCDALLACTSFSYSSVAMSSNDFQSVNWNSSDADDVSGNDDVYQKENEYDNKNQNESNTVFTPADDNDNGKGNDNADDKHNGDFEGSGLITQTMILGAQDNNHNIIDTSTINGGDDSDNGITNVSTDNDNANNNANMGYQNKLQSNETETVNNQQQSDNEKPNSILNDIENIPENEMSSPILNQNTDNTGNSNSNQHTLNVNGNIDEHDSTVYDLKINVYNPQTEHEGSNSYTTYHLKIKTNNPKLSSPEYIIERRYSDFDFLHKCLSYDFPTLLIPPLPNKQRLEYIKGGRFTEEFVTKRCNSLNVFINRVIKHPKLSKSDALVMFLGENSEYWNTCKLSLQFPNNPISNESLTDLLINSFKKPHIESKYSKNFKEIDHQRLKLQENLNKIDKIYSKIVHKQESISKDLSVFSNEFNKLTVLLNNDFNGKFRDENELDETTKNVVTQFKDFSGNLKKSSDYYLDLNQFIEFSYLNNLKDLEHYLISLGQLIKLKDYKILDYEMLNSYLEKTISERDNLVNGGSLTSTTEGTISYLSKKLESLTGLRGSSQEDSSNISASSATTHTTNPTSNDHSGTSNLISERIEKLNSRIALLETEKVNAKKVYETFENDLLSEWTEFQKIKDDEINESLKSLSDSYMLLFDKSNKDWQNFEIKPDTLNFSNKLENPEVMQKYFDNSEVLKNDEEIRNLIQDINE